MYFSTGAAGDNRYTCLFSRNTNILLDGRRRRNFSHFYQASCLTGSTVIGTAPCFLPTRFYAPLAFLRTVARCLVRNFSHFYSFNSHQASCLTASTVKYTFLRTARAAIMKSRHLGVYEQNRNFVKSFHTKETVVEV